MTFFNWFLYALCDHRKSGMVMEEGNVKPVKLMSSKLLKEENQRKQRMEAMKKNESLINVALDKARMDESYKKALFKKVGVGNDCSGNKLVGIQGICFGRKMDEFPKLVIWTKKHKICTLPQKNSKFYGKIFCPHIQISCFGYYTEKYDQKVQNHNIIHFIIINFILI